MHRKYHFFFFFLVATTLLHAQATKKVVIDADTGNEVDDLYAVVRALIEPSFEVIALNATQWQASHWAVEKSMEESYRLNQVLLGELGMSGKVKSHRGAEDRLFDWGYIAQHSAAAYYLIQEAKQHSAEDKLTVIALGALTNVASAILIAPDIQGKIDLYWLGTTYDFENNILRKRDFNCMMDPQALAEVLDSKVECHIIPVSVANQMTFDYEETIEKMPSDQTLNRFLLERWYHHLDGGRKERVIWDLAIIEAIIHPEWATQQQIRTSPENGNRDVWYYSDIDEDAMRDDFFEMLRAHLEK
ncbi:MAG: nucleoside hydrolase [Bacteroidota bacterium]